MRKFHHLVVEFIGTFALIFIGVSAIVVNAGLVGVAFAHGLTIAVMVSAMGYISGGFFNPAVVVGALVGGKISPSTAVSYIIVQLLGGVLGAFAVKAIFPAQMVDAASLGATVLGPGITMGGGILMEAILTFFLVIVVYGTGIDTRAPKLGGLLIGFTIVLDILAGGPVTGGSMNPARTLGPAVVGGYWADHIVYWIGPLIGGALAGLLYSRLIGREGMKETV